MFLIKRFTVPWLSDDVDVEAYEVCSQFYSTHSYYPHTSTTQNINVHTHSHSSKQMGLPSRADLKQEIKSNLLEIFLHPLDYWIFLTILFVTVYVCFMTGLVWLAFFLYLVFG